MFRSLHTLTVVWAGSRVTLANFPIIRGMGVLVNESARRGAQGASVRAGFPASELLTKLLKNWYLVGFDHAIRYFLARIRASNANRGIKSGLGMELILNLVWAVFSVALIGGWLHSARVNKAPRLTQICALLVVLLLLLPVISLSDDLMAMRGLAETDTCLRRALGSDTGHPTVATASFGLPETEISGLSTSNDVQEILLTYGIAQPPSIHTDSLNSRPPPRA